MEENLFRCITQRKKTSSVASHNGGKYLSLWDTTEEILLWDTMRKIFLCWIPQFFCVVLWDAAHRIRFCCGVGYNGRNTSALCDTTEKKIVSHPEILLRCIPQREKTSSIVSYNGGKPSPMFPTTKKKSSVVSHNGKNLFSCIPQQQKNLKLK
jgi:hypothetical protein